MRRETRIAFNAYLKQLAQLNNVDLATESFAVAPSVQQTLVELIQQSSSFLSKIAFETVVNQEGDKVGLGVTRPIASRVNTRGGTRRTQTVPSKTTDG